MTHPDKSLLRLIACGGAADGKSTLLKRLSFEAKSLRTYAVADIPGNGQHTRNLVTEASTADLAIILIDARKGMLVETRRHTYLVGLLGIRNVVVAVNKMDLVGYSREVFAGIDRNYREFAEKVGLSGVTCVPVSAVNGDNITTRGSGTPWYDGPTITALLESAESDKQRLQGLPFRMPVQSVNRPNQDSGGFAGTIASGIVRRGQRVRVQPSGRESNVARIVTDDGDLEAAFPHQVVTLTLTDDIDVSRGDLISAADAPAPIADQFEATVVWMSDQPLLRGRNYLMKIGARTVTATVAPIKHQINVNTLEKVAATKLELNEIGVVDLELDRAIAFDPYRENHETGGFILIDRIANDTVGAGMLHFALRRADNVHWQPVEVDKSARQALAGHRSGVVWMTGLSGAGKSTLANTLEKRLYARGLRTYLLDGDNVRHGLNKDLGFTAADRVENIRRIAEVARLMVDAGVIVITAFISPFRAERRMARELMGPGEFIEVFVDAPLAVAESRDPKGHYKKARRGDLKNFTGIDSPYESPENPEVRIDTATDSVEQAAEKVYDALVRFGLIERN